MAATVTIIKTEMIAILKESILYFQKYFTLDKVIPSDFGGERIQKED